MTNKEIREKLNTFEYNFLKTNEHLGDNIILLTISGSHSYGTNIEDSDLDIRGIATERPQEIIGLANFEQFENTATDTVIYGLKKFIKLAMNCNPNIIEMLGTREEDIIYINDTGRKIRDNLHLFLSKKAYKSFGGYAYQQLKRLKNHMEYTNVENINYKKVFKHAMHLVRLLDMSIEILEGKGVNTFRPNNANLLDIRNQCYSIDEIIDKSDILFKKLEDALKNSPLPDLPDYKKIEEILMDINKEVVSC